MKYCIVFNKGLCTGCVGLGEENWYGPFKCPEFKRFFHVKQKKEKEIK